MHPPFEVLYVVVLGANNKRIYNKPGPARARVTGAVYQDTGLFTEDVTLWSVDQDGWKIDFQAKVGDHHSKITWDTAIESNKRRRARYEQQFKDQEEADARAKYEHLRKRFEK